MAEKLEVALRSLLLQDVDLTSLVVQRIHWDRIPDGETRPYIKAQLVGDKPNYRVSGKENTSFAVVQLDIWHEDVSVCTTVRDVLRRNWSGFVGDYAQFHFRVKVNDVKGSWVPELRMYRRIVELEVGYVERT